MNKTRLYTSISNLTCIKEIDKLLTALEKRKRSVARGGLKHFSPEQRLKVRGVGVGHVEQVGLRSVHVNFRRQKKVLKFAPSTLLQMVS